MTLLLPRTRPSQPDARHAAPPTLPPPVAHRVLPANSEPVHRTDAAPALSNAVKHSRNRSAARPPGRSWVTVDLAAIRRNVRTLRRLARPARVAAVVKADGYGHGAAPVARAAIEAGAAAVCVFDIDEAAELRAARFLDEVIVFCPIQPEQAQRAAGLNLAVTVADAATVDALSAAAERLQRQLRVHLYIDSGMSHHGLRPEQACALAAQVRSSANLVLEGVYTHFPSPADQPEATREAFRRFERIGRRINPQILHASNSAPFLRFPETALDMIRPGLAVYGLAPNPAGDQLSPQLQPAAEWKTTILAIREIPAGAPVSYGGTWTAERDTRLATIGAGYAAGLPRSLAPGTGVLIQGQQAPIRGTICMDSCMADITDIPQAELGDEVTIIGRDGARVQTAADLARAAGTVPHAILTGISPRVPRVYAEEEAIELGAAAAG